MTTVILGRFLLRCGRGSGTGRQHRRRRRDHEVRTAQRCLLAPREVALHLEVRRSVRHARCLSGAHFFEHEVRTLPGLRDVREGQQAGHCEEQCERGADGGAITRHG